MNNPREQLQASNRNTNVPDYEPIKPVSQKEEVVIDEEMTWEVDNDAEQDLLNQLKEIKNADMEDEGWVGDRVEDVYSYLSFLEHSKALGANFLAHHGEAVTPKMRTILVDWLVQVARRFKLRHETVFLTVAYLDRYLQKTETIDKTQLQLIGISSMLLASKNEEIYSPSLCDFVFICDGCYTKDQIRDMELEVFGRLDCDLSIAFGLEFLRRFGRVVEKSIDPREYTMAKYLLELSLLDYDLSSFRPSLVAAGSLRLSMSLLGESEWSSVLKYHSGYDESDLENVGNLLCKLLYLTHFGSYGKKFKAIRQKYSTVKNMAISNAEQIKENESILKEGAKKGKTFAESRH